MRRFWLVAKVAAEPGFEPGLRGPEPRVLPLHHSANGVSSVYRRPQRGVKERRLCDPLPHPPRRAQHHDVGVPSVLGNHPVDAPVVGAPVRDAPQQDGVAAQEPLAKRLAVRAPHQLPGERSMKRAPQQPPEHQAGTAAAARAPCRLGPPQGRRQHWRSCPSTPTRRAERPASALRRHGTARAGSPATPAASARRPGPCAARPAVAPPQRQGWSCRIPWGHRWRCAARRRAIAAREGRRRPAKGDSPLMPIRPAATSRCRPC